MYEVDNRYPEVAEAYEKVRGVRHHGRVNLGSAPLGAAFSGGSSAGSAGAYALTRAARINNLKRSFWTSAAAVVAVICLLLVSPSEDPRAAEPETLREPAVRIVSAVLNEVQDNELDYSYRGELNDAERGELNDAERGEVTVTARSSDGELLAKAGPFSHSRSETSPPLTLFLSRTEDLSQVVLEVVCVYPWEEQTRETRDQALVVLRTGPPEPVTGPATEPVTEPPTEPATEATEPPTEPATEATEPPTEPTTEATEPPTEPTTEATEPTETETPFVAPTLSVASADLNGTELSPLRYSYTVTLNSAERLRVTAQISSETGAVLGSGGPWDHADSGTSPARSSTLTWTDWPSSVTLTLTGTYTEKGVEKTVTATQTITTPEEPFEAPTLQIAYARVLPLDTAAIYSYTVTLNDAAELEVKAVFTYEEEYGGAVNTYEIGADGPYTHTGSGPSPDHKVYLNEYPAELPVTLTLTGAYEDNNGVEHKIEVAKTLDVFVEPQIIITSAERDSEDPDRIIYSAQIKPNSADELEVMVEVDATDVRSVSDGPFTFTSDGALTDQTILANGSSAYYVTLTLTGSYTVGGEVLPIVETADLDPFEPFKAPTLSLLTAEVEPFEDWGDAALTYSYHLDVGTAENVSVKASVAAGTGPPARPTAPRQSLWSSIDHAEKQEESS